MIDIPTLRFFSITKSPSNPILGLFARTCQVESCTKIKRTIGYTYLWLGNYI